MLSNHLNNKMSQSLPTKIDHVIVCASYEDRCLSMYNYLHSEFGGKISVFYLNQFKESAQDNIRKYAEKFDANLIEVDNSKPTTVADAIVDLFKLSEEKINVVLDISTFTREILLILVKYFKLFRSNFGTITLYYRAANVADNLSSGLVQVRSVLGYMGNIETNKPLHVIVLSGFEYERAKEVIDILEPNLISIGYGSQEESVTHELQKKNKQFSERLIACYSHENINVFEHSLIDPLTACEKILAIAELHPDHNVVILPLNNKISTVAAGLAAHKNADIQICYPQMASYNTISYSQALDDCFIFHL